MAVTLTSTYAGPARFHGDVTDTDHPHYPEVCKLNDALTSSVQTALTAGFGANTRTVAGLEALGLLVFAKGITAEDSSTGVTAGTTETAFTNQVTIPANTLAVGDRIRIVATVKTTAAHSTDTLALKLVIANNADLKTTAIVLVTKAAADATANDIFRFEADLRVTAIGAAATCSLNGHGLAILAGGATWQNVASIDDVTTVGSTSAIYAGLTYTWNASDAGNVCRIKECFVTVTRPSA